MNKNQLVATAIIAIMLFFVSGLKAQWQTDKAFDFKINVPSSWSKNSYMDGTDKVYDFYSPDENAAVQLRAFEAPAGLTMDILVSVYEDQMLPAGTRKEGVKNHVSKSGISGKQGTYQLNYNGTQVGMGVFYTIQNGKGYVLSAMIPVSMLEQKEQEVKSITQSFALLSASPSGGGSGSLRGLTAGSSGTTGSQNFRVTRITLCDQLDNNNMAAISKNEFNSTTPEIHAVVEYQGYTSNAITVVWIYQNNNSRHIITEDNYTFKKGQGGIGVVSLSKPDNDWPVGEYWVEFKEGPAVFKELRFFVKQGSSGLSGSGSIDGKYRLLNRSDGKNLVNYHYIFIGKDGSMDEKYQPKNSGNYVGGGQGTWRRSGNNLILEFNDGTVLNYSIQGDKIVRKSSDGVIFTFIKSD